MRWLTFFWVVTAVFIGDSHAQSLPVEISELMAGGQHLLADENDDFPDWIELHNKSSSPVSLEGWQLTDDSHQPGKWRFPSTNIAAEGYMVVFASEKNRQAPGLPLHTNFRLSGKGEYLALRSPSGEIATEFAPRYPTQVPGVSFGTSE